MEIGKIVKFKYPKNKNKENKGIIIAKLSNDSFLLSKIVEEENFKNFDENYNKFVEFFSNTDTELLSINSNFYVDLHDLNVFSCDEVEFIDYMNKDSLDYLLRKYVHFSSYQHFNVFNNDLLSNKNESNSQYIPASGKVLNENDLFNMIDASMDMWLTSGRFDSKFCEKFGEYLCRNYICTVNSGSSANLLALSALKSYELGDYRLVDGDEVISLAAAFPTTVSPIIQNNLVPVFIDAEIGTYNINIKNIEKSISDKTKCIFIAHTLGNPFNLDKIMELANKYNLWVIEDNCDALGSKYNNKLTGTFGHISTFSFYPAHHITMGEGGAISTDNHDLYKILLSLRDWGRDCYCNPGKDNTCNMRFSRKFGSLPLGYDHKYVYSHFGYNLKITDWQAAIGLSQLDKLDYFTKKRKNNFKKLFDGLKKFENYLILPQSYENTNPSWFGFPITVKDNAGFKELDLVKFLEENSVGTRQLFAGNILRQPLFIDNHIKIRIEDGPLINSHEIKEDDLKVIKNTEKIANDTFWIGVWPHIGDNEIRRIIVGFEKFIHSINL